MANNYETFYVIEYVGKHKGYGYYFNGKTRIGSDLFSHGLDNAKRYADRNAAKKVADKLSVTFFGKTDFKLRKFVDTLGAQQRSFDALYSYLVKNGNTSNYRGKYVGEPCANNPELSIIEIYVLPDENPNTIYMNGSARNGCFFTHTKKDSLSIADTTLLKIADKLKLDY